MRLTTSASRSSTPSHRLRPERQTARSRAFTLPELIIVVLILAILAAIVVPQFTTAGEQARTNSLKMNLFRIRQQIDFYKQEHGEFPTVADFADQLTNPTDVAGNIVAEGAAGALGPYLRDMPTNPMTDTRDVGNGEPGTSAWYFDPDTGEFYANDSAESRAY